MTWPDLTWPDHMEGGWETAFCEKHQRHYYFNRTTNVSQWEPPAENTLILPPPPRWAQLRQCSTLVQYNQPQRLHIILKVLFSLVPSWMQLGWALAGALQPPATTWRQPAAHWSSQRGGRLVLWRPPWPSPGALVPSMCGTRYKRLLSAEASYWRFDLIGGGQAQG